MDEDDFFQAVQRATVYAKKQGREYFVYENKYGDGYEVLFMYRSDWLFRAYPGGRKVLSFHGAMLMPTVGEYDVMQEGTR